MSVADAILISMALLTVAMLAASLFKNFSIPYTVLLVAIGLGLSELSEFLPFLENLQAFKLTPELVFFVFLPALIFESGLNLDARLLLKNLAPVLTLAIPALLISTTLVGFLMWLFLDIDLTIALLFGALISATDPVAVVALFKELGASKRLNILVEGESLFNDATAIVVFGILLTMLVEGSSVTLLSTGVAVFEFLRVFVGGAVIGLLIGILVSEMLQRLQSSVSAILTMSIVTAYGSFIVAEHGLHVSGVMATVSAAMTLNVYGLTRITTDVKSILAETWELVALIANSLLFLLVGLSINTVDLFTYFPVILVVVVFVQLARAASVYSLVPLTIRLFKLPKVSLAERHIMWWGGLKGGLAIAIVLSIPEFLPGRELLINLTLGVVLFTLMVNAWTIRPLMKKLKLDGLTGDEKIELDQGLKQVIQTSAEMLDKYVEMGIIQPALSKKLDENIEQVFTPVSPPINADQSWREVYLSCLRMELFTLDNLYKSALISQYTLLDIRYSLQLDREAFHIDRLLHVVSGAPQEKNIFHALEMWVLKALREKNWAAGILSDYQHRRLTQRIQHEIAGVVMTRAVLEMLSSNSDFDTEASEVMVKVYRQRYTRWRQRLDNLRNDFGGLFEVIEKEMFTRSSLIVAQNKAEIDFHHGETGIKAFNKIKKTIDTTLQKQQILTNNTGNISIQQLAAIPLFSGLSDHLLKILSAHVNKVTFLPGDIIIGEGDKGDALYIIDHGTAEVTKNKQTGDTKVVGKLEQGDFFGEMALLGDHFRTATVTAKSAMMLLRLTRADIIKIADKHADVKLQLELARDARPSAKQN